MTFLDPTHFRVVAGQDVVDRMRLRRSLLKDKNESLIDQQREDAAIGFLGAEIASSLYGYSVRYDSGLQNWGILASSRTGQLDGSFRAAAEWAKYWTYKDPQRRYAFTRVRDGELIDYSKHANERGIRAGVQAELDRPLTSRVPTEQDVAFAQRGYENTDKAWKDALHDQFGDTFYAVQHSVIAWGRLGSELRKAWDARSIASDHYLAVWNAYLGGHRREFP